MWRVRLWAVSKNMHLHAGSHMPRHAGYMYLSYMQKHIAAGRTDLDRASLELEFDAARARLRAGARG